MSMRRHRSADLPLLAWGEALRAQKWRRARLRHHACAVGAGAALLIVQAALPPTPRLLWNATASIPLGLYRIVPAVAVDRGQLVVAQLPADYRRLAAERHYLPFGVPLVKRVAALAGDEVCAFGTRILVNGRVVATRRSSDAHGRPLPAWGGCRRLGRRQMFLLADHPDSFDGRYFGASDRADLIGEARLLWAR